MDINNLNDLKGMLSGSAPTQNNAPQGSTATGFTCSACNASIEEKVAKYSQSRFKRPLCMDCQRKASSNSQDNSGVKCDSCGSDVPTAVVEFCKKNSRFNGKVYCRDCQSKTQNTSNGGKCADCGADIEGKVASYSQTKFGRYLCRNCQSKNKPGVQATQQTTQQANPAMPTSDASEEKCYHCGNPVPSNVAQFSKEHLKGRVYCLDCQKEIRAMRDAKKREAEAQKQNEAPNASPEAPTAAPAITCSRCNSEISQKVADYSASHFNGKIYCRDCQQKAREWAEKRKAERAAEAQANAVVAKPVSTPVQSNKAEEKPASEITCRRKNCSNIVTFEIAEISKKECDGKILCKACQEDYKRLKAEKAEQEKANVQSTAPQTAAPVAPVNVSAPVENEAPVRRGSVKDLLDYEEGDIRRHNIDDNGNLDFLTDNVFPFEI